MTGLGWFASIIVGGLAGWLAEKFMNREHNLMLNVFMGIVGAMLFNAVLVFIFGSTLGGWIGQLFVGFVGACVLIAAINMFRSRA
ncbi:Transglycosylase-associated protein [Sulfitobacter noctilucicola]|uniref:Putative membrane protein YeaQ/YmgE (Transglycosylase-associated protein family) n=1 Tax=Sulfitobacter noctilucicola TaxID=1342301 RepID=A0A7W6M4W5_9RHOB|nr:GlsB/YeaQ/YmgE family stress response membrane protein [Sulfitobacter noctilucicola]KIN62988.1 Transglycosylase-associated protein [Sulfitobacter noctilucicola]MBB4172485.1 putative membrane protein YeaQ/YmgE (transglycosylase-associated protein family) [Sulfitobacter noctilucicola]